MLLALTVLESEVALIWVLEPACGLSLEFLKAHEPVHRRVVGAQVKLLSVEVLMEMFRCPRDYK